MLRGEIVHSKTHMKGGEEEGERGEEGGREGDIDGERERGYITRQSMDYVYLVSLRCVGKHGA